MHREKEKLCPWRRIWSISSHLHLFANRQIEQPKHIRYAFDHIRASLRVISDKIIIIIIIIIIIKFLVFLEISGKQRHLENEKKAITKHSPRLKFPC